MNELIGISAALTSTLAWALGTVKLKDVGEKASPVTMSLVKAFYCALILITFALITKTDIFVQKEYLFTIIASGIIGITIGDCLFFASLKRLSPIVLSVILLAGPDIATGILSFIVLKELPPIITIIGIIGTLFGLSFLIFPIKDEENEENKIKSQISGYIFALLSLICMAVSTVILKPVLAHVPTLTATIYRLFFGGLALLCYTTIIGQTKDFLSPFKDKSFRKDYFQIMSIIAIFGFWLSIVAFKNVNLITASTLMSLEPLFILIMMMVFNKYKPLKKEVLGIIIILIGIFLISYGEIL